jgi:predicted DNA-binding protein
MSEKEEKKKIGIEIPMKTYRRTNLAKVLTGKNFQDIVTEAIEKELNRLGIPDPDALDKNGAS